MTSVPVMQLRNVSRTFTTAAGPVPVLHNTNLTIHEGEFIVVTGPSGSGKSTFLHLCGLIDQPSSGSITLHDRDISHVSEEELCRIRKLQIGIVFQRFCLLPHRSAYDNVMFRFRYLDVFPPNADALVKNSMSEMGIDKISARPARLLSSGEQQRVAIARAVVQEPALLLADEPTGNLDADSSNSVMNCFRKLNRKGLTVIMVTHDENWLSYASRHLICAEGTLKEANLP